MDDTVQFHGSFETESNLMREHISLLYGFSFVILLYPFGIGLPTCRVDKKHCTILNQSLLLDPP